MGRGLIAVVKSCMTMEDKDIFSTIKLLKQSAVCLQTSLPLVPCPIFTLPPPLLQALSNAYTKPVAGSRRGSRRGSKSIPTSHQVHCQVIAAECKLLASALTFLREGVFDKVKAGFQIRSAWQQYTKICKEHKIADGSEDHLDPETRNAIQFGIGVFNLLCSILPAKLLKVVSLLGFPSE